LVLRNDQTGVPTAIDSVTLAKAIEMLEKLEIIASFYAVLTEEIWQILAERTKKH
jgi:hypothetical protein